ncbi:hypothetical protein P9112_012707 [Eukaryota sp. TZLM1-RC]
MACLHLINQHQATVEAFASISVLFISSLLVSPVIDLVKRDCSPPACSVVGENGVDEVPVAFVDLILHLTSTEGSTIADFQHFLI